MRELKNPDLHAIWCELQDGAYDLLYEAEKKSLGKWDKRYALVNIMVSEITLDDGDQIIDGKKFPKGFSKKSDVTERLKYVLTLLAENIVTQHGEEGDFTVPLRLVDENTPDVRKIRAEMAEMLRAS